LSKSRADPIFSYERVLPYTSKRWSILKIFEKTPNRVIKIAEEWKNDYLRRKNMGDLKKYIKKKIP
jgi:hypothetical protein